MMGPASKGGRAMCMDDSEAFHTQDSFESTRHGGRPVGLVARQQEALGHRSWLGGHVEQDRAAGEGRTDASVPAIGVIGAALSLEEPTKGTCEPGNCRSGSDRPRPVCPEQC